MLRKRIRSCLTAFLSVPLLPLLAHGSAPEGNQEFFETRIRPVLMETCFKCHGGDKTSNGLRVDSREHLVAGGEHGPAIVPGDPNGGLILRALSHQDPDLQMPPKKQLKQKTIEDFRKWITEGAIWPSTPRPEADKTIGRHWAFKPVSLPQLPPGPAPHPIDRFIAQGQRQLGVEPLGKADRNTLIRRAAFDLTGLPPSPNQIHDFLNDTQPGAFARVLDQLLASPRYGERWGRHWLDLVRYSDTAGDDSDYPIPQAVLYRDYVIDAFNHDKPYDRFIQEQLAGDILAQEGPRFEEQIIATGYIAQAKRFATRKHEDMHLIIEDTLHTTGQVMLGLTLRCARCHDHKFDPVTMEDYYALYGFFESTVYPHPGSEEVKQPSDLIPLIPESELQQLEAEFDREYGARIAQLREAQGQTAADRRELNALLSRHPRQNVPLAYAVKNGTPVDSQLQRGGDPNRKDHPVPRGVPRFLHPEGKLDIPKGQSGRLQLARWLTDSGNPLTARVMVNRIWQHHFGKPIVPTPSNFGLQGEPPSHPELLDWLAVQFIESGWSIKAMHRLIMLSDTWQRSSLEHSANEAVDPANAAYWRFDRRRLDAESIRDSMLQLGGQLSLERPGPHPFPSTAKWKYTAHHQFKAVYASPHRSVYLMVQRLHPHPYLALFNGPDTTASTAIRDSSTVALQALFMANSDFAHTQAAGLAKNLLATQQGDDNRINHAYELLFARPPNPDETERAKNYLRQYTTLLAKEQLPEEGRETEAWTSLARVLLGSNEYVYLD